MPDIDQTLLGLFTEIAIVEHLTRTRVERNYPEDLNANQFGILNYFVLTHPAPDTIGGISWAFQQDDSVSLINVNRLAEKGYVALTEGLQPHDTVVALTEEGRAAQEAHLERIGPEFKQLVSEIPAEDLDTAYRVLHEIRLVLDNLPDR